MFVGGPKKQKTSNDSIEISFNSNTDEDTFSQPMDGVFEYLPIHTMTAEERARHRVDKRKQSSLASAVAKLDDNKEDLSNVSIDQKKDILCEGQSALWDTSFD